MDATFFTARPQEAMGVSAWDDIPDEPAGESLRIASPGALSALGRLLCGETARVVAPLRDATCRSFPVWAFDAELGRRIAELSDEEIDAVAERWLEDPGLQGTEGDLYEVATLLADLREAIRDRSGPEQQLFVLIEQRAL
jgi:hypothetical protein